MKCVRKRGIIVSGDFMKKIQQIEIYERDRYVVKANELIQKSRFNLTLQQQKIVLYLISQIERNDKEFKLYSFSIQQFCKVCGINYTSGKNYNDLKEDGTPVIKELGWTPDTVLKYPIPEMYRYLVARLAEKFSALNESNVLGVQKELTEAKYAFEAYFEKNKSAWKRINNVNPATITDWLV